MSIRQQHLSQIPAILFLMRYEINRFVMLVSHTDFDGQLYLFVVLLQKIREIFAMFALGDTSKSKYNAGILF